MALKTTIPMASRRTFVGLGGSVLAAALSASARGATPPELPAVAAHGWAPTETHYRTIDVDGLEIFYREAGPEAAPVVLLLHGFPTSSRMFRNLIPMLADKYRVIAPDYPAFGHSAVPSRSDFNYTHAHLSEVIEALIEKLRVTRFAMYVMDFGGPIGYRLILKHPDRVRGVVVQNTPAFGEPIEGPLWATELAYWKDGSSAHRDAVRSKLTPEAVRNQYIVGTREPSLIDPDNWTIDSALARSPRRRRDHARSPLRHQEQPADGRRCAAVLQSPPASGDDRHRRQRPALPGRQHEASCGYAGDRVPPDRQRSLRA